MAELVDSNNNNAHHDCHLFSDSCLGLYLGHYYGDDYNRVGVSRSDPHSIFFGKGKYAVV